MRCEPSNPGPSRRAVLASLPAAALAVGAGAPGAAATARAGERAATTSRLLQNAVAMLAGTAESNARPEVAGKLTAIESTALSRLAAMDAAAEGELFAGLPLGASDPHLNSSFQYLHEIALATRVPGESPSRLRGDVAVQRRVIDALAWLHDRYYGDQRAGYYGNWFTWEIGISSHVSRTLVLLRDELAAHRPELTATYVASMDAYLRNGRDGDVDLDSRFHTGANLADITTNRVLQGAVLGDAAGDARVAKAVADQLTVYATIDPYALRHGVTDGFYADGSFIQHGSVAYTGSYGISLLTRVMQSVKILDGTDHLPAAGGERDEGPGLVDVVRRWVVDGFAPVVFEGWMMESVRGRAASRATTSGYDAVAAVVEAVVDLSGHVEGPDAAALRGYVKHLRASSRVPLDPARFVSPVSVARYADILADASTPAADLNPPASHAAFNAMERTVHRRPGFAFALARSSSRISKYEYMNGENLLPWFQGDGAHHLYLAGQDQSESHGVDQLTVCSPDHLPGVVAPVEERGTVPELYGGLWYENPEAGFTSSSEAQNAYVYFPRGTNTFSGGARLGDLGVAGLVQSSDAAYAAKRAGELPEDFVAYRNAEATRSWFLFDEEIVVLAAGVGDGAGRAVTTTLDSRIADPSHATTLRGALRDGTPWTGPGTAPLAWLRYADTTRGTAVGYVLLAGPAPTAMLRTVTRSRRVVRMSNPDTEVTRQVFALRVDHPAGAPPATLAYALLPHATEAGLASHVDERPLRVLANTPRLQAVRHTRLDVLAANAFTEGEHRAGPLTVTGPASVLLRRAADGTTSLAVADPTTERERVTVLLRGRALAPVTVDDGVRVTRVPGGTRVEVTTHHAYGRSLTATLRP
ncbi:polysaccharide lyase family 8 super-sandwich domain-containing protein [Streptomyces sp. 4N509B]|uniref:polysaccharide lyase family 8 super-sandwich domain-containing protein n=1 Tax=Streptomyces sp. 4N509B TaxID=3457413 RepID=UPI003FD66E5F